MDDFIVDDSKMSKEKVSNTIRKMYGYDPSKYNDSDDSDMEASVDRIFEEERISEKIGRRTDRKEYLKNLKYNK